MAPRLTWIGLGNMGRGICKNLVEKGNLDQPLTIFNRTVQRAEDLSAKLTAGKSTVAPSLAEAVTAGDIVFTCLGDDAAVEDTYAQALKTDIKGKLFVECSTIHPTTTETLAKSVLAQGGEFVACPVFGAPAAAEAGQLVCVPAGPAQAIDKVKPYLKGVIGRENIEFRDQPYGQALRLKIIGNTVVLSMVESVAVGHTLAEKVGLENQKVHELISLMFPGPFTGYSTRMLEGQYYKRDPLFPVDLARKDARHAMELAESSGAKVKVVEVIDGHFKDIQKHMGSKGDLAGVYGAVRQEAGLPFENEKK